MGYTESMSGEGDTLEEREDREDILEERENMLQDSTLTEGNMLQDTILNMLQDTTQIMVQDTILTMLRGSIPMVGNMLQDSTLTEGIMQRDSTEETEDRVATFED